ncbi:hypothetical protein BTA51_10800 [Hahella sp. CCB-MM4]|uniref:general secretion pathway protein GspB n=1 Tax=Hahella sp. (strain CCB-MM4) TaxID=1926491 RepID=UPI000B9AD707|nr:general secretion pathway protein GspB [Hahella sp. CCB-MM4]OZG73496.1 hypothetical protein BTA51_10800 [Hahella sp. CCB-MM4]
MSYILEALQKSESERHQEKLPGHLANSRPMLYSRNSRSRMWPVILTILLLVNLAGVVYLLFFKDSLSFTDQKSSTVPEIPDTSVAPAIPEKNSENKAATSAIGSSVNSGPDTLPAIVETGLDGANVEKAAASQTGIEQDPMALARAAIAKKREEERKAMLAKAPAAFADEGLPESDSIPPWEAPVTAEEAVLITPSFTGKVRAVPVSSASTPASDMAHEGVSTQNSGNVNTDKAYVVPGQGAGDNLSENVNAQSAEENDSEYPSIADLDKSFQSMIPPLVFNSHIYSSDPKGRRIMINNNYLREGQSFSGIQVVEITESGVVLKKNGQPFKVSVVRNWAPES